MARDVNVIKAEIEANIASNAVLNSDLTSTSATAKFRAIAGVVAQAIADGEIELDRILATIETRANEIQFGTLPWYVSDSLLFQNGDTLALIDGLLQYAVIDESARIIKLASADVLNGVVRIKVAKDDGADGAEKLTAGELSAFADYWTNNRPPGVAMSFISTDPDRLKFYATIRVNPQLIDPATGESTDGSGAKPVEDAINNHLLTFQSQDLFGGKFAVMKLVDAIQAVSGVENVVADDVQGATAVGSFSDILATTDHTYLSTAGYMEIDTGTPLSGSLTYTF